MTADSGRWTLIATPRVCRPIGADADFGELGPLNRPRRATPDEPPLRSGRMLVLAYGLGGLYEPTACSGDADGGPYGFILDIPGVLAYDRQNGVWTAFGDAPEMSRPAVAEGFSVGPLTSVPGRAGYLAMVRRGLGAIGAGDVYQVNLAHRLSARFGGSPRAFFAALLRRAEPIHGMYAEIPAFEGASVCSASPELFLRYDSRTRRVVTRPMKGTRPIDADPDELRHADKDRAELNMITDLMRNDLGRVCEFGSVRVDTPRAIEPHGRSVLQATSTVSGTLRQGLSHADLLAATFPPGSVTGTPKIRAMQLIDELEPTPRGFYCGAIGWLDDSGDMELNVAIRTAVIARGELHYHVGAGIVADSDPEAEWGETLDKAGVLAGAIGGDQHIVIPPSTVMT